MKKTSKQQKDLQRRRWITPGRLDQNEKQISTEEYRRWYKNAPHF